LISRIYFFNQQFHQIYCEPNISAPQVSYEWLQDFIGTLTYTGNTRVLPSHVSINKKRFVTRFPLWLAARPQIDDKLIFNANARISKIWPEESRFLEEEGSRQILEKVWADVAPKEVPLCGPWVDMVCDKGRKEDMGSDDGK
jgi:hypothetical protein